MRFFVLLGLVCLFVCQFAWAQVPSPSAEPPAKKVVQYSGIVVLGPLEIGVPGVFLYVPNTSRGVISNNYGYFSMPVLEGDSVIIQAIGFKRQYAKVPNYGRESYSVVIPMQEDTLSLPSVDILPFQTEEEFKEAFLALDLNSRERSNMLRNLSDKNLAMMRRTALPMDGRLNHTYFMQQQVLRIEQRNTAPTLQLLNPFAWGRFLESVRRGDLKKKPKYDDDDE